MEHLSNYMITYFGHLMTANEKRAYDHLIVSMPLTESEQRFFDFIAWEEAHGRTLPEEAKSLLRRREAMLSKDPEVLRLASGGFEAFFERTTRRILSEDRDRVFLNNCPSCGALARTPQARQCRFCGHDWHRNL
jgi:hypothetical protein